MTTKRIAAFSFLCPLDLEAILRVFETIGTWKWTRHDSDTYGDYLIGWPPSSDETHRVRLFCKTTHYVIDFDYDWAALNKGKTADHIVLFVRDRLLPAIGAGDVQETDAVR